MSLMLCVCLMHLNAQTQVPEVPVPKKNSIYLEAFGNGIIYSMNYDHLFLMKKNPMMGVGARIGVSYGIYPFLFGSTITLTTLPAEVYLSRGKKNCLELGLGYTTLYDQYDYVGRGMVRLGYRYRAPGGFIFGAGVLAAIEKGGMMFPLPQVSFGLSF
jgi:hypothetical protein